MSYVLKEKINDKKTNISKSTLLLAVLFFIVGVYFVFLGFYSEKQYIITGILLIIIGSILAYISNYYKLWLELEYSNNKIRLYKNNGSKKRIIKEMESEEVILVKKCDLIYNKKNDDIDDGKIVVSRNCLAFTESGSDNFLIIKTDKKIYGFNLDTYFEFLIDKNKIKEE